MRGHVVRTAHIQRMIRNALDLAERADGHEAVDRIPVQPGQVVKGREAEMYVVDMLEKAAADLRHAAAELEAERLSGLGWSQV